MIKGDIKRQSLQPRLGQSPPLSMTNKRDHPRVKSYNIPNDSVKRQISLKEDKRKSHIKLLQLLCKQQQQQYETSIQTAALNNEISFLSEKVLLTEEIVFKWKKDFRDLQSKYAKAMSEHHAMRQELEDTRRMLEESEHIRSRWFLKTAPRDGHVTQASLPKKLPPPPGHSHYSHSLPSNLLRFLKISPKKPSTLS